MSIFRRTEDVLEIQEGPSTSIRGKAACDLMQDNKLPFITLLSTKTWIFEYDQFICNIWVWFFLQTWQLLYIGPDPPARPCTANGFHNVTTLEIKGSKEFCEEGSTRFNEVNLRCESPESMQFLQHCDTEGKSGWLSYYELIGTK